MPLTASERETHINLDDASGVVRIWTAQRSVIHQLRKRESFTLVASGEFDGSPWAEFEVPATAWTPWAGAKRRQSLAPGERAKRSERMRTLRNVASAV